VGPWVVNELYRIASGKAFLLSLQLGCRSVTLLFLRELRSLLILQLSPQLLQLALCFPLKHQPCFAPCPLCPGVCMGPSTHSWTRQESTARRMEKVP